MKIMFWCVFFFLIKIVNVYLIDLFYVFSGFLFCKKLFIFFFLNFVFGLMCCVIGVDVE